MTIRAAAAGLLLLGAAAPGGAPTVIDHGRDIYELARGAAPIAARRDGGEWRTADRALACRACHGDSGEGLSEGTIAAPALAGPAAEAGATGAAWLGQALLHGRGGQGRMLAAEMPRYRMALGDIEALSAYLRALPQAATPGVDPARLSVRVSTAGAGLGAAARAALAAKLDALAASLAAEGGVFGRNVTFTLDGDPAAPALVALVWRADRETAAAPMLALRPPFSGGGLDCGALDPPEADQMRVAALWAERQGMETATIEGAVSTPLAGKTAVIMPGARLAPGDLAAAVVALVPAELAAQWSAAARPAAWRIVAAGDMNRRSASARALLGQGLRDPREALVAAVYLEGAAAIVETLRASGRRIRRMGFCDALRARTRAAQSVSIVDGGEAVVLSAADL